jgi:hypothetical protein
MFKAGFAIGASHFDNPPPEVLTDLDGLFAAEGFRFANRLAAWIEVEDGRIADAGYAGRGYICRTRFGWGPQREMRFQPTAFPEIRTEPAITATASTDQIDHDSLARLAQLHHREEPDSQGRPATASRITR